MAHLNLHFLGLRQGKNKNIVVQKKNALLTKWVVGFLQPKPELDIYSSFSEDDLDKVELSDDSRLNFRQNLRDRTVQSKLERCEKLHKKMQIFDSLLIFLSVFGLLLEILNYETNFQNIRYNRYKDQEMDDLIKILTTSTTAFCLVFAVARSITAYSLSREHKFAIEDQIIPYFRSTNFKSFLIDFGILIIFPYPCSDFEMEFSQLNGHLFLNFGSILLSLMMLRFLFLFRLFLYYSKWSNIQVQMMCRENGAYKPLRFALKACLKDRPHYLLLPVFAISTLAFGIALQVFEKPFECNECRDPNGEDPLDFSYLYNCMWLVLLTLTTVGFGDFYARTHVGRFITIVSLAWGTFLISLMIIMLNNFVIFSRPQEKSFNYLVKLFQSRKLKEYASKFISRFLLVRVYLKYRKMPLNHPDVDKAIKEMLHFRCMFREIIYTTKFTFPNIRDALISMNDEMAGDLRKLKTLIEVAKDNDQQLDRILESQKKCIEMIQNCTKFSTDSLVLLGMSKS
jgi:potassium intermediate/small conductance calcium-activated channel subfamily N protein 2